MRKLTAEELQIKARLLEGQSRKMVASNLKISYDRVRRISDNLEFLGEIKRVLGCKSPILYFDPKNPNFGCAGCQTIIGYVPFGRGMIPPSEVDPSTSRVHLNGSFVCEILQVGTRGNLQSAAGDLMGWWRREPSRPKGRVDWYGSFKVEGYKLTFCHRSGSEGSETLVIWPEDAYLNGENAMTRGSLVLVDRANLCISLLEANGWRFGDLTAVGRFEAAHLNSPMVARMNRSAVDLDAPVQADTSKEYPEVEAFNDEDNDILGYVPEHIRQLYARAVYLERCIDRILAYDEARVTSDLNRGEALRDRQGPVDWGMMYR